jgi:exodeoxyribonuclease V alpha subunit
VALAEQYYNDRIQFQVLSPKHGGKVGVTALNSRLRELLNPAAPHKQEVRIGYLEMREGDRVMVLKNNYQLLIYNGDVGKIDRIDKVKQEVHLKIFGDPPVDVALPFSDAKGLLGLAYAVTVHKSQGLEYDRVIMPLVMGFRHQLQRNLLYTAVTRAKEKVVLIGQHSALAQAVANSKEDARYTLFPHRIREGVLPPEGV